MRPGHCAPERAEILTVPSPSPSRFNEAGALCPGKSRCADGKTRRVPPASMRPGHCAPERVGRGAVLVGRRAASMRPGHCAPERGAGSVLLCEEDDASMRPGHCAPERGRNFSTRREKRLLQ